ncbi:MAG TPA: F0F1 ATP synthase subunit A [Candidatus Competibacteraceae bacterium]|nr:F0F1 ATP synthase subunit A [Candidatus Competibacteraceae bacterium]MCP5134561.1 F0F1 ATP synthase subunit A [Gammaproteobacteria bacterium]HPF60203.1 F0F1 ATP synthase subunit A [Candidatus Competibacteraceae bacterium]HRY17513.1 F0F1 ATP synthase subunit A [Candidatus Competibacteraceae bacterium]
MNISSDQIVLFEFGFIRISATLVFTWLIMALLVLLARRITRRVIHDTVLPPWQNLLEVLVEGIQGQIRDVTRQDPAPYLPFIGTLFIFIAASNLLAIIPGFEPPTGSLSTTTALALCVFIAVPLYGIQRRGWRAYLKNYVEPTPVMLPLNIIGELSRTLALAVRLYGNVMSGAVVGAILLIITPLFFPVLMHALELLTGLIQAYIFAILATVYLAAATAAHEDSPPPPTPLPTKGTRSINEH